MNNKLFVILTVLAVAGLLAGAWGIFERLAYGLQPVAFGSYVPWGLWVAFYLFFLGLSAGAFLITILAYVMGMKQMEKIGVLAAFVVLVVLLCEMQFILLDLGSMRRAFYQFFLTPSFTSMMTWMFILFNAMLIVYALKTFFLIRGDLVRWSQDESRRGRGLYRLLAFGKSEYASGDAARDEKRVNRLAWVSLPVGLAFYAINGAFFAVVMHRHMWNSAFTPVLFVLEALLSGGALVVFLGYFLARSTTISRKGVCLANPECLDLGRIILSLLATFLLLEGLFFLVGYQRGAARMVAILDYITAGPNWWLFWIVHLLIGSAIPLFLLLGMRKSPGAVAWACFLIFVTFGAVRYNFVAPEVATPSMEGLEAAFVHPRLSSNYAPNLNEWLVSLWVISFGVLAFLLGSKFLPVIPGQGGGDPHAH